MLPNPGPLQYCTAKYGESVDPSWLLVGKSRQKLFSMKKRTGTGEDLDDAAKGNGSNRNPKSLVIRIATRHKIPSAVYADGWEAAISRVEAGEDIPSESEIEDKPSKGKSKAKKSNFKPRVQRARSLSEIEVESESSDDSASEDSGQDAPKAKQERDLVSVAPKSQRRSSRLSESSYKPLFQHDSEVEEIAGFPSDPEDFYDTTSRKRTASPSFDVSDSERKKSRRSVTASRDEPEAINVDDTSDNEDGSPFLRPATSSFLYDPNAAGNTTSVSTSGPFLSASTAFFGPSFGQASSSVTLTGPNATSSSSGSNATISSSSTSVANTSSSSATTTSAVQGGTTSQHCSGCHLIET
ncbi:hypothetical protein C8R43DRAFT_185311 [Mycena crocata]|nr:hypothetical protein C8R43DRAFT_185311 [Mycena crocata]